MKAKVPFLYEDTQRYLQKAQGNEVPITIMDALFAVSIFTLSQSCNLLLHFAEELLTFCLGRIYLRLAMSTADRVCLDSNYGC